MLKPYGLSLTPLTAREPPRPFYFRIAVPMKFMTLGTIFLIRFSGVMVPRTGFEPVSLPLFNNFNCYERAESLVLYLEFDRARLPGQHNMINKRVYFICGLLLFQTAAQPQAKKGQLLPLQVSLLLCRKDGICNRQSESQ